MEWLLEDARDDKAATKLAVLIPQKNGWIGLGHRETWIRFENRDWIIDPETIELSRDGKIIYGRITYATGSKSGKEVWIATKTDGSEFVELQGPDPAKSSVPQSRVHLASDTTVELRFSASDESDKAQLHGYNFLYPDDDLSQEVSESSSELIKAPHGDFGKSSSIFGHVLHVGNDGYELALSTRDPENPESWRLKYCDTSLDGVWVTDLPGPLSGSHAYHPNERFRVLLNVAPFKFAVLSGFNSLTYYDTRSANGSAVDSHGSSPSVVGWADDNSVLLALGRTDHKGHSVLDLSIMDLRDGFRYRVGTIEYEHRIVFASAFTQFWKNFTKIRPSGFPDPIALRDPRIPDEAYEAWDIVTNGGTKSDLPRLKDLWKATVKKICEDTVVWCAPDVFEPWWDGTQYRVNLKCAAFTNVFNPVSQTHPAFCTYYWATTSHLGTYVDEDPKAASQVIMPAEQGESELISDQILVQSIDNGGAWYPLQQAMMLWRLVNEYKAWEPADFPFTGGKVAWVTAVKPESPISSAPPTTPPHDIDTIVHSSQLAIVIPQLDGFIFLDTKNQWGRIDLDGWQLHQRSITLSHNGTRISSLARQKNTTDDSVYVLTYDVTTRSHSQLRWPHSWPSEEDECSVLWHDKAVFSLRSVRTDEHFGVVTEKFAEGTNPISATLENYPNVPYDAGYEDPTQLASLLHLSPDSSTIVVCDNSSGGFTTYSTEDLSIEQCCHDISYELTGSGLIDESGNKLLMSGYSSIAVFDQETGEETIYEIPKLAEPLLRENVASHRAVAWGGNTTFLIAHDRQKPHHHDILITAFDYATNEHYPLMTITWAPGIRFAENLYDFWLSKIAEAKELYLDQVKLARREASRPVRQVNLPQTQRRSIPRVSLNEIDRRAYAERLGILTTHQGAFVGVTKQNEIIEIPADDIHIASSTARLADGGRKITALGHIAGGSDDGTIVTLIADVRTQTIQVTRWSRTHCEPNMPDGVLDSDGYFYELAASEIIEDGVHIQRLDPSGKLVSLSDPFRIPVHFDLEGDPFNFERSINISPDEKTIMVSTFGSGTPVEESDAGLLVLDAQTLKTRQRFDDLPGILSGNAPIGPTGRSVLLTTLTGRFAVMDLDTLTQIQTPFGRTDPDDDQVELGAARAVAWAGNHSVLIASELLDDEGDKIVLSAASFRGGGNYVMTIDHHPHLQFAPDPKDLWSYYTDDFPLDL